MWPYHDPCYVANQAEHDMSDGDMAMVTPFLYTCRMVGDPGCMEAAW